ncbi:hypothetical protein GWI33_020300 [Rhynchophorus ferrugineus]|uniref:Uncharacterized protein n=1 Tax=Rhynchophorus ferrugineus TaxID=354439 RepID=A0A834M3F4_RHYFE|nr:hypothetical protein GWI33_020300 [Rhynchophorus ferrugineus]
MPEIRRRNKFLDLPIVEAAGGKPGETAAPGPIPPPAASFSSSSNSPAAVDVYAAASRCNLSWRRREWWGLNKGGATEPPSSNVGSGRIASWRIAIFDGGEMIVRQDRARKYRVRGRDFFPSSVPIFRWMEAGPVAPRCDDGDFFFGKAGIAVVRWLVARRAVFD